jgi:hypothetical protein
MGKTYRQGTRRSRTIASTSLSSSAKAAAFKPAIKPRPGRNEKASWTHLRSEMTHGREQYSLDDQQLEELDPDVE